MFIKYRILLCKLLIEYYKNPYTCSVFQVIAKQKLAIVIKYENIE